MLNQKFKLLTVIKFGIFFLIFLIQFYFFINTFIITKLLTINIIIIISILYIIFNLFCYFITIYQYSKYTSYTKFFWYRVFNIFWFLEFFLFFIMIFLFLISPNEVKHFFDPINQRKFFLPHLQNKSSIMPLILCVNLLYWVNLYKSTLTSNTIQLSYIFISFWLVKLLITETYLFLFYLYISNFAWNGGIEAPYNIQENEFLWDYTTTMSTSELVAKHYKPSIFINNIILIIKFFHILLIIYIYILMSFAFFFKKNLSTEINSIFLQNVIFLIFFIILNYVQYFKIIVKLLFCNFYENINFFKHNIISYLFFESLNN